MGSHVCHFARLMWSNPEVIQQINYTDIYLIPKVSKPEFINQFWFISLCSDCE